jgi:hypothetical protein
VIDIFKPEDFEGKIPRDLSQAQVRERFCVIANKKLNNLIEACPVVYLDKHDNLSHVHEYGCIKRARLMFVEELPKEPCNHRPHVIEIFSDLSRGPIICQFCGVELVVEWKEKKD